MPRVETRHFGSKDYSEDSVIYMPCGMPGFESETTFLLLQVPEQYPLVYMQSSRTADLCFVALPVFTVDPQYKIELSLEDGLLLGVGRSPRIGTEVLCLTLVAIDGSEVRVNLLAPILVNLQTRTAAQCINAEPDYSHQHTFLPAVEAISA